MDLLESRIGCSGSDGRGCKKRIEGCPSKCSVDTVRYLCHCLSTLIELLKGIELISKDSLDEILRLFWMLWARRTAGSPHDHIWEDRSGIIEEPLVTLHY